MDDKESVFDNETFHQRLGALAFAAILLTLLTVWMIEPVSYTHLTLPTTPYV